MPAWKVLWTSTGQCESLRRWGLWDVLTQEGGALMNGISALIKGAPESSHTPSTMWGHKERAEAWKRALT